jgi:hypothetical protein
MADENIAREFELFLNSEPAKESFKRRLRTEEGKGKSGRPGFVYPDIYGNPTIGIGHLITKTDKGLFQKLFGKGIDYESLVTGKKALSDAQMETLLDRDVDEKLATSKGLFPAFNRFSRKMKGAILDGVYRGDLPKSPDTIELINKGFFARASMEYLDHAKYRESKVRKTGIYKRMDRNAEIMADEENYMMRPLAKANRDENWVSTVMDRFNTKDTKKAKK